MLTYALIRSEELLQFVDGRQRRSPAERAAFQRRERVAISHARFQILALQHSVNEAGMKGVAGAGRITTSAGNFERRRFNELALTVVDCSARAQSGADDWTTITRFQFDERCAFVIDAGQPIRKIGRSNEHID